MHSASLSLFVIVLIVILYVIMPIILRHSDNRNMVVYIAAIFTIALVCTSACVIQYFGH
jgi:hypothetical protein